MNTEGLIGVAGQFAIGKVLDCVTFGNGLINDTYLVCTTDGKYVLQALNTNVFHDPCGVMENMEKVTAHLTKKNADKRCVLQLVYTKDGENHVIGEDGKFYRMTVYIEDALCLEKLDDVKDFYACGFAFGKFQKDLSDFDASKLHETIPDFHNTPMRYAQLMESVEKDMAGRRKLVEKEIAFAWEREAFTHILIDAHLPLRVSHNDTKSSNVMLDAKTHGALCVIDLDTIMPGLSVTDFGDAIRYGANYASEDEKDLSLVGINMALYQAFRKGFLDGNDGSLTDEEVRLLPYGARMMALEQGMRFLKDYLDGDIYYKTGYEEHNLVRARNQFRLVEDMEAHWDEMCA